MKQTVVNNEPNTLMLDDGTQLGAAYTPEAKRLVELSEGDRKRYVSTGRISIIEPPVPETPSALQTQSKERAK